jgi:fatty-acyl-CoA synthase
MPRYQTVAQALANLGADFPENGQVYQDLEGKETRYSFAELERATASRAKGLQDLGLTKGDRVGLIISEPEGFLLSFYACLRVGVVPVPLYPPMSLGNAEAYVDRTARVLAAAGCQAAIVSRKLTESLAVLLARVPGLRALTPADALIVEGEPVWPTIVPEDLAFLQYTSGSTSEPKGVMVTHQSLVANAQAIIVEALDCRPGRDTGISWLPLYHDMGLIGFGLAPTIHGVSSVFIPTMRFIKNPNVWFEAMVKHRGTIGFAPNFAYQLMTQRARPEKLASWDLSHVRILGCGAEPVNAGTMRAFNEVYKAAGLPETALMPAYGMAEATLCIATKPHAEAFKTRMVDAEAFRDEGQAKAPTEGKSTLEHVSCGRTYPGHEVVVMGPAGERLPEGVEGELCFRGPSVTAGYFENPEATAAAFTPDGFLHTGDLGYLMDGEVYVTGRLKDLIIVNGRNVHPQTVEWAVSELDAVRRGNVVAFSVPGASTEELVVAAEVREVDEPEALKEAIRERVQQETGLQTREVVLLRSGQLPKTSSGKVQRRLTRQWYLRGDLGVGARRATGGAGDWKAPEAAPSA